MLFAVETVMFPGHSFSIVRIDLIYEEILLNGMFSGLTNTEYIFKNYFIGALN